MYDLHSNQFPPPSREDSADQLPIMAFAKKSNTMPKIATINQMTTFNIGARHHENNTLPASQSNPGAQNKTMRDQAVGDSEPHNALLPNGDLEDGILSRPSSTNSSNYSNHAQPYLSVKRGTAMPTVPAKLYAIPLYIDPPQFKSNSNNNTNSPNIVSPGSTTSEATHMS